MAAKEALTTTFKRLEQSRITNVPIIIVINTNGLKSLIKHLEHEEIIVILKKRSNECIVKVRPNVTKIKALEKFISVKKSTIAEWARRLLPQNKGQLIISTQKALVSYTLTVNEQVGGQIVGLVW